ncbi:unnamed protein product [Adineta steineri]|uniref:F-box domain-containing protein n=1 Tax=Adineta steineri TaxID=433720 RepID=A0A820CYM3_9BILA|nr:unnamed protein product [Adineta steineri]
MKESSKKSTLEMLSDELLLEICKYLLYGDILRSFVELNSRMTRMITQYSQHVLLHKMSITHSSDLYDKYSSTSLPKLSRLIQLRAHSSISIDLNHFSVIPTAASNLVRLDLPFGCLLDLLAIKKINHLLYQRIKSMAILNTTEPPQMTINEEYIHLIASNFYTLRDLFVDLKHLKASTTTKSNEIKSFSMESMLLCLLS